MSTAGQVERLLRLAPFLQANPDIAVDDAAAALQISPTQLVKDLHVLMMCGTGPYGGQLIDVDLDRLEGEARIRIDNADVLQRPTRFTAGEVMPLLLGLQVLRDVAGPHQREDIDRARAKLEALTAAAPDTAGFVQVAVPSATDEVLAAIEDAQQRRRRLRLRYAGHRTSDRLVDVHQVLVADGLTYLQAWVDSDVDPAGDVDPVAGGATKDRPGGWRTFRLDRILAAEVTDEPAREHPAPSGFAWQQRLAEAEAVDLDVDPRGAWVAEAYPVEASGPRPDGEPGLRVRLRVADHGWFTALLLRLGATAQRVEPVEYSESAARAATAALEQYRKLFGP